MPYVVREDVIAFVRGYRNIVKGTGQTYELTLYKDNLRTQLDASRASVISVAVLGKDDSRVLMYNNPPIPGISDVLNIGSPGGGDIGKISFEITPAQSNVLYGGEDLKIIITVIYNDYYPTSKTYELPPLKVGKAIGPNDDGTGGDGDGDGSGGNFDYATTDPSLSFPKFQIEKTDAGYPTGLGLMTVDSKTPNQVSKIVFRNLDKSGIRITSLENMLVNRITNDNHDGIITIHGLENPEFYCVYKIRDWNRVDITVGNGDGANDDGIELSVSLESMSNGPGVTKSEFEVDDWITYSTDSFANITQATQSKGVLTYADKNKQVQYNTEGNNSATGVFITYSPYYDSYVMVEINGISVEIGSDVENSAAYFSSNNGASAVEIEAIRFGDQLIWNGDVAGYELEVGDDVNFIYEADVDDIR